MKTLALINWIIIGIYVLSSFMLIIDLGRPNDAMGRGMTSGFLMIALILLGIVVILNILPYKWTRILALVFGLSPVLVYVGSNVLTDVQRMLRENARTDGGQYFEKGVMRKIAVAILNRKPELVAELLEHPEVDINQVGKGNNTLLGIAASTALYSESYYFNSESSHTILDLLLAKGADPNLHIPGRNPVLVEITQNASIPLFEKLLQNGADPNALDSTGVHVLFKPLIGARDQVEKLRLLLDYGSNPNVFFNGEDWRANFTPLIYAAYSRRWEECLLLVQKGADLDHIATKGDNFWEYYNQTKQEYDNSEFKLESFEALRALISEGR